MGEKRQAVAKLSVDECLAEMRDTINLYPQAKIHRVLRLPLDTAIGIAELSSALMSDTGTGDVPTRVANRLSALAGRVMKLKAG
jgi:hypothetical protein